MQMELKPGTVLRTMMEEHEFLDEFMNMMKERIELDRQHLKNLKELRDKRNRKWENSRIWPLASPFVSYLADEIKHIEDNINENSSKLDQSPKFPALSHQTEGEFNPLRMPECLEPSYIEYLRCHELVSAENSVKSLKEHSAKWKETNSVYTLPEADRAYRKAIHQQQRIATQAFNWYQDEFPELLERHQERVEAIKTLLKVMLTDKSRFASNLSIASSTAIHHTAIFTSTEFIGSHHDDMSWEKGHVLVHKTRYYNYMLDELVSCPLLGLGVENTIRVANRLLDDFGATYEPPQTITGCELSRILRYEHAISKSNASILQNYLGDAWFWECLKSVLFADSPLLPLPRPLYYRGMSRSSMETLLRGKVLIARKAAISLLIRLIDTMRAHGHPAAGARSNAAVLLTFDPEMATLIGDIWRKWDIIGDCSLPSGVERVWNDDRKYSEIVWKKTSQSYSSRSPPISPTSSSQRAESEWGIGQSP